MDPNAVAWRKSSHSGNTGGNCVEAAMSGQARLARDSKHPDGPVLSISRTDWEAFLNLIKSGRYDLS